MKEDYYVILKTIFTDPTRVLCQDMFINNLPNFHSFSQQLIEKIVKEQVETMNKSKDSKPLMPRHSEVNKTDNNRQNSELQKYHHRGF